MELFNGFPRRSDRTAFRVVDGEALVMIVSRRELHRLNTVGSRVFELCDGATTVDAITNVIVREFAIDWASARIDVDHFLSELAAVGALSFKEAP